MSKWSSFIGTFAGRTWNVDSSICQRIWQFHLLEKILVQWWQIWAISHILVIQLLVKTVPIEEGDYLEITWPITPSIQFYKEGPCHYLSHLIGHEGEGSIFHIIKELGKFTSTVGCCTYTFADLFYWDIVMSSFTCQPVTYLIWLL